MERGHRDRGCETQPRNLNFHHHQQTRHSHPSPMNLIRFFFRGSRPMMVCTIAVALLSGACNAGLMAMVTKVLQAAGAPVQWMLWAFLGLVGGRLITNFLTQVMLA